MNTIKTPSGCRCSERCPGGKNALATNASFVITKTAEEFFEAGMDMPRSLIVLRQETPIEKPEVRRVALVLGGVKSTRAFGDVRTIAYDPSARKSTALSLREHKMHVDGSFMPEPPGRFILSFYRSDPEGGGESLFLPLAAILAAAPEDVLTALYTAEYRFARDDDGGFTDAYTGTVLSRTGDGSPALRWRHDENVRPEIVEAHGTDAQGAIDWLAHFLEVHPPLRFAAATGDTLLIPNRSLLHGRTKLSENSPRTVFRAWVA